MKPKYIVHEVKMDLNKVIKSSFRMPTDATKIIGIAAVCNETNEYYKVDLRTIAEVSVNLNTDVSSFFRINVKLPQARIKRKQELDALLLPVKAGDIIEVISIDKLNTKYYCQDSFSSGFSTAFGSTPKFCPNPNYTITLVLMYA
ncbi:hypothetical protein ACE193_18350 [Bernardetia sp. OM2101]|uniref:hypothetical protein n=1 Tax=Bernardetia sp. OM2101 TaxID=3344876 RepID=UPI0035D00DD8